MKLSALVVLGMVSGISIAAAAEAPPAPGVAPPKDEVEMVLLPRAVAEAAVNWIATPDPTSAIRLWATLNACLADNPSHGVLRRSGPDGCPAVTAALEKEAKKNEPVDAKGKKSP